MRLTTLVIVSVVVGIVSLNLAWEHQVLLYPVVSTADYYGFADRAPFIYRILPALLCRGMLFGHENIATNLNAPFDFYYNIFQLALDTASLAGVFYFLVGIARTLNPKLPLPLVTSFAGAAALITVIFGYFMVPNRALFYPYDFPDACMAAAIFYLCIGAKRNAILLIPTAVFVATFAKETAIFYSAMYLALNAGNRSMWKRVAGVLTLSVVAFVLARVAVTLIARHLSASASNIGPDYEYHLSYSLAQMHNPLLAFSLLNICSYLYVPVIALRKRLDRTDFYILAMVVIWIVIMTMFGIIRELRLFVPATIMLFVILARHLSEVVLLGVPNLIQLLQSAPLAFGNRSSIANGYVQRSDIDGVAGGPQ
jgi:hypothetical protein